MSVVMFTIPSDQFDLSPSAAIAVMSLMTLHVNSNPIGGASACRMLVVWRHPYSVT